MKKITAVCTIFLFVVAFAIASTVAMADQKKAQDVVDKIREADPPAVSTTTKSSTEGQKASEYRPKPPSSKTKEPPPPSTSTPKK